MNLSHKSKIIGKSGEFKVYRDVLLLRNGTWTDSVSMTPTVYSKEAINKFGKNWSENYLNNDHSRAVTDRLGFVKNPYGVGGKLYGDLYILRKTSTQKDTIALIEAGLVNHLSVEVLTEDEWNSDEQKNYVSSMEFVGTAVCTEPACEDTYIKKDD